MPTGSYIRSDAHRKKLSDAHKLRYSKIENRLATKEIMNRPDVKERHRLAMIAAMNRPEVKEKTRKSMLGKKHTEEFKKFISESSKKMWANPEFRAKAIAKLKRGAESHLWKGGIENENSMIRSDFRYKDWRNDVFKRDAFTCQKCGKIGGDIHAHHIKKFSVIIDDIRQKYPLLKITDIVSNEKDLWDISNGITLCVECHKKEHISNGY